MNCLCQSTNRDPGEDRKRDEWMKGKENKER